MISFDSQAGGRYEFKGTGDDIAKDYIGLTVALGRTMIEAGTPLSATRSAISTLCAQGLTLMEMPEKKEETTNKIIDFATGGENADV